MNLEQLINDLKKEEGYRAHGYYDHLGYLTVGIGRCIDDRKATGISLDEAEYLLSNDIKRVYGQISERFPWFLTLSDPRQRALVQMGFQLGVNGLFNFKNMMKAIELGNWKEAYKQALDSKWAKQTPQRAQRLATALLNG